MLRYETVGFYGNDNFMRSKTIFLKPVGDACNLHCRYCFENGGRRNHHFHPLMLQETIDFLTDYKNFDHLFIVFHGGEPLLSPKTYIDDILKYISKNFFRRCNVQIQTNAVLLDDEWLKLLYPYRAFLSLSASCDPLGDIDLRTGVDVRLRNKIICNVQNALKIFRNVGIVSVMHRFNKNAFEEYLKELIRYGICNWSISRVRAYKSDVAYLSESEYDEVLIRLAKVWIQEKLYKKIRIQPLNALMGKENKICIYMHKPDKCFEFITFAPSGIFGRCYHLPQNKMPSLSEKCKDCRILYFCGGGCVAENNDEDFCVGRKKLHRFVEEIKNEDK